MAAKDPVRLCNLVYRQKGTPPKKGGEVEF